MGDVLPRANAPAAPATPLGVDDSSGHNQTRTVKLHGARYKLRQSFDAGSAGAAAGSESEATDPGKLARLGRGFGFFDLVLIPVDVYLDFAGTAQTLFFVGGGTKLDEAVVGQMVFATLDQPDLVGVIEGKGGPNRSAAVANLDKWLSALRSEATGIPAPNTSNLRQWPTLLTKKPITAFAQLETNGTLPDAAANTDLDRGDMTCKLSGKKLVWMDPGGAPEEVVWHRKLPADPGPAGGALPTLGSYVRQKQVLAETTFNLEADLACHLQPAPLPETVEGAFDTLRSLTSDMVPGLYEREIHGRFFLQSNLGQAIDALRSHFEKLIDEALRGLETSYFRDTMAARFPYHFRRLHLDNVSPQQDREQG